MGDVCWTITSLVPYHSSVTASTGIGRCLLDYHLSCTISLICHSINRDWEMSVGLSPLLYHITHLSQHQQGFNKNGVKVRWKRGFRLGEVCWAKVILCICHNRNRQGLRGLWKFGKDGIHFSRPWKSVKTEWGLWKFVNFVVFRALGKNCQLISRKLHSPRLNSS